MGDLRVDGVDWRLRRVGGIGLLFSVEGESSGGTGMGGWGEQNLLVSGGSDGLLVVWAAEVAEGTGGVREAGPKINVPKVQIY